MALRELLPWRKSEHEPARSEHPLVALHREMNRLFEDFFRGFELERFPALESMFGGFSPRVNVVEDDKEVRVTAELPGVTEKDVEVTLTQNTLTIKGEKKEEHEEKGKSYYRAERAYGTFQRVIPLPAEVEQDKAEATFKNGVLTIRLPKTEAAREQRKRIEIKTGE